MSTLTKKGLSILAFVECFRVDKPRLSGNVTPMENSPNSSRAEAAAQNKAIKAYFAAKEHKPTTRRSPERLRTRVSAIEMELKSAPVIKRIQLMQEKADITALLSMKTVSVDMAALENGFVQHAKGFSDRKGITASTWRKMGVPGELIKRAGIN